MTRTTTLTGQLLIAGIRKPRLQLILHRQHHESVGRTLFQRRYAHTERWCITVQQPINRRLLKDLRC